MKKRSPLTIIFITVFIDLIGFGMIIPLSPYLGREYGATAFEVGLLLSVYSLMQIVFSPIWGKWSDSIGRRPIILASLVGTGLAHLAFAYSGALWMLFVSRTLAGIFGANISTAFAYAADVSESKDRSKAMGTIGAAFALGFIFGPFFGGILGDVGVSLGELPPLGHSFPALVAAAICFINFGMAMIYLKESLPPEKRANLPERKSKVKSTLEFLSKPVTGALLMISFLASFSMSQMEASLFLLVKDKFDLGLSEASFAFAYVGIVIAITQGFLLRKILPAFGERKLLLGGIVISGVALALIGFAPTMAVLAVVITAMSFGFGIRMPALNGSLSLTSSAQEQGALLGVNQSLQALGRVLGPALGGFVYGAFGAQANFLLAGFCGLLGLPLLLKHYKNIPDMHKPSVREPEVAPMSAAATSREEKKLEPLQAATIAAGIPVAEIQPASQPTGYQHQSGPQPVVIQPQPRPPRPVELPKIEHIRKEDRITLISAFQFRSLFTNNVNFMFFDLRPADAGPQYSRSIKVTVENIEDEINKRTTDKRAPLLILCEDGVASKEVAKKIAELGFINVVIVDGGARALNKTGVI